jgi:hypothetical protein
MTAGIVQNFFSLKFLTLLHFLHIEQHSRLFLGGWAKTYFLLKNQQKKNAIFSKKSIKKYFNAKEGGGREPPFPPPQAAMSNSK